MERLHQTQRIELRDADLLCGPSLQLVRVFRGIRRIRRMRASACMQRRLAVRIVQRKISFAFALFCQMTTPDIIRDPAEPGTDAAVAAKSMRPAQRLVECFLR